MMRALAMDFRQDSRALDISDQYMFGRALLVSPIVQAGASVRTVYLPAGTDWYDFWSGERLSGGQVIAVQANIARIPLHVRAGAILPLGPVKPYADAPSNEPLEIRVYPGRDGRYELYDDEGDGFGYEQGRYATIQFVWHNDSRTLDIGARQGRFPNMRDRQQLLIVCGAQGGESAAVSVLYSGAAKSIGLPNCASPKLG
jgi:alpha-D-xyloside xylohydrolase